MRIDAAMVSSLMQSGDSARSRRRRLQGAVLLEVILALILFVGAAAILTGGMNASIQTLDRARLSMHASNLAVSIMSELQMGLRPATATGEEPFDAPFEEWTWELVVADLTFADPNSDASGGSNLSSGSDVESGPVSLVKVEVVIRHGFESIAHRLVQVVPVIPTVVPVDNVGEEIGGNSENDLEVF